MSGSINRADGWKNGVEEQYIAVNPSGNTISVYETVSPKPDTEYDDNEDNTIRKITEKNVFQQIECIQSSNKQGCVAVGVRGGTVKIFDNIFEKQVRGSKLGLSFPRSCTSLSFSQAGYLAASYDRARQDHSIKIYDLVRPERNPVASFAPNEVISSVKFDPYTSNVLLSGSTKLLREFDIRVADQPNFQILTKCTMNISINLFNENIFSSTSQDGIIALWDRRKVTAQLDSESEPKSSSSSVNSVAAYNASQITLHNAEAIKFDKLPNYRKSNSSPFRFSPYMKNEFGILLRESQGADGVSISMRRYKYDFVPAFPLLPRQFQSALNQAKLENPNSTLFIGNSPSDRMFVATVRTIIPKHDRVISFDYAPNINSSKGIDFVCMRQSGNVFRMAVPEIQNALDINSYNGLTFGGTLGLCTKFAGEITGSQLKSDGDNESKNNNNIIGALVHRDDDTSLDDGEGNEIEIDESESGSGFLYNTLHFNSDVLLTNDICAVMRRRASLGYNMDSRKNMELLEMSEAETSPDQLKNTWKWIDISYHLVSSGKMTAENYDFGYLGVSGIWNMASTMENQPGRYSGSSVVSKRDLIKAAKTIIKRRTNEIKYLATNVIGFKGKSKKEVERRLAMYVIGWDFGPDELEDKFQRLIASHNWARAAGWALFHNDIPRASKILAESKVENLKIMSAAMSAYSAYLGTQQNNPWKEHCRKLSSDLEDPYLRAIFGYIADENWWDVLDETALPLRERLGVALRFLPDDDLTLYLNRLENTANGLGEIEGVIVTGLTENGINLLQSYLDKTSDTQTAALIASFACPKYFKDVRVEEWVYDYRNILNSWGMFSVRARYDVARTKLSKRIDGSIQTKPAPRQAFIQCVSCHMNISRPNGEFMEKTVKRAGKVSLKESKSRSKSVCPHCNYPLPRCAICLLSQGGPISNEIVNLDLVGEMDRVNLTAKSQFQGWFSVCLSCNHTMHAGHAEEWFSKHFVCPVPDCNCRCNDK